MATKSASPKSAGSKSVKPKSRAAYPRANRLTSRSHFTRLQAEGRRSRAPHLLVSYAKREEGAILSRLGITVTKKIDKRAVRRNYIKRAVREWFRHAKNYLQMPVDLVVVALSGAAELTAKELWAELDDATKRARLIPKTFDFSPERSASVRGR